METITVSGYKDLNSRISYIMTGIILLLALNLRVVVWIKNQVMSIWLLVFILILARVFWKMRRVFTRLRYTFSNAGITIHLPNGKEYFLDSNNIDNVERLSSIGWYHGRGITYIFWKNQLCFTTSTSHLLKITMNDGRAIIISPKEYVVGYGT